MAAGVRSVVGRPVAAVLAVSSLPVDIRHNAKIDRDEGRRLGRRRAGRSTGPQARVTVVDEGPGHGGLESHRCRRGECVRGSWQRRRVLPTRPARSSSSEPASPKISVTSATREVDRGGGQGCDAIVHVAAKVGVLGPGRTIGRSTSTERGRRGRLPLERRCRAGWCTCRRRRSPMAASRSSAGLPILRCWVVGDAWYPESKAMAEIVRSRCGVGHVWAWWPSVRTSCGGPATPNWSVGSWNALVRVAWRWWAAARALVDTTYIDNAVAALVAALDAVRAGCTSAPVVRMSCRTVSLG